MRKRYRAQLDRKQSARNRKAKELVGKAPISSTNQAMIETMEFAKLTLDNPALMAAVRDIVPPDAEFYHQFCVAEFNPPRIFEAYCRYFNVRYGTSFSLEKVYEQNIEAAARRTAAASDLSFEQARNGIEAAVGSFNLANGERNGD